MRVSGRARWRASKRWISWSIGRGSFPVKGGQRVRFLLRLGIWRSRRDLTRSKKIFWVFGFLLVFFSLGCIAQSVASLRTWMVDMDVTLVVDHWDG